jgi:6-pyruvoyltetrahydropterin/6-carboxytetrahydropterin synthase
MTPEQRKQRPELEICKVFKFSAGHWLPQVALEHPCRRQHGHNYQVEVVVRGELDPMTGFVMDFTEIKRVFQPLIDQLDHRNLNNIEGLENPTAENIALWLADKASMKIAYQIRVWETNTCWARWTNYDGLYRKRP